MNTRMMVSGLFALACLLPQACIFLRPFGLATDRGRVATASRSTGWLLGVGLGLGTAALVGAGWWAWRALR